MPLFGARLCNVYQALASIPAIRAWICLQTSQCADPIELSVLRGTAHLDIPKRTVYIARMMPPSKSLSEPDEAQLTDYDRLTKLRLKPYFTRQLVPELRSLDVRSAAGDAIAYAIYLAIQASLGATALLLMALAMQSKMFALVSCFALSIAYVHGLASAHLDLPSTNIQSLHPL